MFGDSDYSLSSVDSNPTFDQWDDGGASSDFSNALQSYTQLGSEIAGVVANFSTPSPAQAPVYSNMMPPTRIPPGTSKNNAAIILVVVLALGIGWVLMNQNPRGA